MFKFDYFGSHLPKVAERCRKRCCKRILPSVLGHMGKFGYFSFSKIIPPWGANPKEVFQGNPQGPGRGPCQIWLESLQQFGLQIRTNKQTDRQASFIYIDGGITGSLRLLFYPLPLFPFSFPLQKRRQEKKPCRF